VNGHLVPTSDDVAGFRQASPSLPDPLVEEGRLVHPLVEEGRLVHPLVEEGRQACPETR
jgi:hypothetical protein